MNNPAVDITLSGCRIELQDIKTNIIKNTVFCTITPFLVRYALIRACGTIEVAMKALVADYCSKSAGKQVTYYIDNTVRYGSLNPNYENMCYLLKQFDDQWHADFKSLMNKEPNKKKILSSLKSLVDDRNAFAHGGNPTPTIDDIITYFDDSLKIVTFLDAVIL